MQINGNLLLEGIVGSTAYGLAHKDSDIDKKGIFAWSTNDMHGLENLKDVYEQHAPHPDVTWYEAKKWANLALKCNPNILEILYLPDDLYTHKTDLGKQLIDIRHCFLSAPAIRSSYINYARSQLHQIEAHGHFGADLKKRTEKHARHLVRLMMQGFQLYRTGELDVRLSPQAVTQVRNLAEAAGKGNIIPLKEIYRRYETAFDETFPAIPNEPDKGAVEWWLRNVRRRFYQ